MPRLPADARRLVRSESQAEIDAASEAHARGALDDAAWCERVSGALAAGYLADGDDPRWQSGFDGDANAWRGARELVLDAVDRDGTFLDVGCANGHLMECLDVWGRERGWTLIMHGLELDPRLAALARRRLPAWADRIYIGNALDWEPPLRFDYVRTGLEYVPVGRGAFLAVRLLRDVVAPGGRLIVGPVHAPDVPGVVATIASAGLPNPTVREATDRAGKTRGIVYVER
jgi:SAM-dependent methyltransferase